MRAGTRGLAVMVVVACATLACRRPPVAEPPAVDDLPELGRRQPWRLPAALEEPGARQQHDARARGRETRPAVALEPGETRACVADVPRPGWLTFAIALDGAPPGSSLAFEVRIDGRLAFERRQGARASRAFASFTLPLPARGRTRLEFVGRIVPPGNGPTPAGKAGGRILLASARVRSPSVSRPRRVLIWVSQDTVRADHLSLYGYPRPTSSAIDARASRWVVFDDAVATAPWTLPSLVSQFTGRHPSRHGAVLDDRARGAGQASLFEALAASGFTVLGVTANRFVATEFGTVDGFDALSFTPGGAADVNRLALRQLRGWPGGDLALFVHYMDAHFPYEAPEPFGGMFVGRYRGPVDGRNFVKLRPGRAQPEEVAQVRALYDGELAYGDRQIDALLEALDQRGLLEGAVLVYSADHGEAFLEHGKWLHSRTVYQELLHVPLALAAPGVGARRVAEPVSLVDLAPTLLDLLAVPVPASMEGRSLRPLLQGRRAPEQPIYAETEETTDRRAHKLALRQGSLKYILTARRGAGAAVVREELFDLRADPAELSPLPISRAGALPGLARAYLAEARRNAAPPASVLLSPEDREALRALGYVQ